MSGKIIGITLLLCAVIAGVGLYYLQLYHFYEEVAATGDDVYVTTLEGERVALAHSTFRAIDSESSPIRFRACFETTETLEALSATFAPYDGDPRTAPGWFDCFDAEAIGAEIAAGTARVFTGQANIEYGIDRVVAVTQDGRGYIWHDVNECGDKAYDGSPLGKDCPPRTGN